MIRLYQKVHHGGLGEKNTQDTIKSVDLSKMIQVKLLIYSTATRRESDLPEPTPVFYPKNYIVMEHLC